MPDVAGDLDRDETDVPFFFANYSDYPLPPERPVLELPADPSVLFGATRCRCSLTPVVPPPDLLVTVTAQANELQRAFTAMGAALAPLAEHAHRAVAAIGRAARPGGTAELEDAADADWPAESAVCCHVCGPDPGHRCDARATTSITHPLPSGGKRTLPLCDPCHAAETAEVARA